MNLQRVSAVLSCALFLCACAYQPITTTNGIGNSVAVGDTVRVTMRDGEQQTFRVTEVNADGLSGTNVDVSYAQIEQLEKQQINKPVVWTLVGIGVAGLAAGGGSGGGGY